MPASPEFDHSAIYVRDLKRSTGFYTDVLRLEHMPDPFHDDAHVWFRVGKHEQLHVISGAAEPVRPDIHVHLAFRVADLDEFMRHLDARGVAYSGTRGKQPNVRPDGFRQVYFQDPDGYWIEVNDCAR